MAMRNVTSYSGLLIAQFMGAALGLPSPTQAQTPVSSTIYQNTAAPVDQKNVSVSVDNTGGFMICPMTDAGVTKCSSAYFNVGRGTGATFSGFSYQDAAGQVFGASGNDIYWRGIADTQPMYFVVDPGRTGALSGFMSATGGGGGPDAVEGAFYCLGTEQTLGAALINGPTTGAYCVLSVGDQLFQMGMSNNHPFSIGVNGTEQIRVLGTQVKIDVPVQLPISTVAGLPTCNAGLKGSLAAVSDATSPTYNGALTGGGGVSIPAYCNGVSWVAH